MVLSALDQAVYSIDRKIEINVYIRGDLLASGLSDVPDIPNLLGVDIAFDIEQMSPTATLTFADLAMHHVEIERGDTVEIDAGFDGNLERIFTGNVKKRRHGVSQDIVDCVGRTAVLTRPFRSPDSPKSWTSQTAVFAIEDILDDLTPPLTLYNIDPILTDTGGNFTIGTVVPARMDSMPPSDMIRKIADVYGHRIYEQKSGVLRIRDVLEAPAPSGYRIYGTQGTDRLVSTVLSFDESNVDTALAFGDATAQDSRAQGFTPTADGNAVRMTLWLRKVAAPTDKVGFDIEMDDGTGKPNGTVLGGGYLVAGPILQVGYYTQIDIAVTTDTRLESGVVYHLVVRRSGAVDAVNYYEVGADSGAGYPDGVANVYDSVGGTWGAGGGDLAFEIEHIAFPALRLLDVADDEDEDQVKKQVLVRGASVPSTTPALGDDPGGDETLIQITGERHTDRDDLVEGDYLLYSMLYTNDLIETAVVADEVAARLVDKYHRVLQSIEIEVPFDPRIDLGSTLEIRDKGTSPSYAGEVTGLDGNWWIRAYHHSLTKDAAVTQVSLFGGDQSGTSSESNPQADFTWSIERELVGNAIQTVVTFRDLSTDADGWLTNHRWVDDYAGGANDVQGEALRVVTFAYDPSVDASVSMTLTVTDNDGNTGSATYVIDTSTENDDAYAPVTACAGGNTCMATFDGGLSWADIATPRGVAKKCAVTFNNDPTDPPVILFGTDNGRIYRSTDGMQTLVLEYTDADGDDITSIVPDTVRRHVIWATTTDRVLVSLDFGDNWTVYTDFNVTANWPRTTITTVVSPIAVMANVALGDDDTRLKWATPITPPELGQLGNVSFWMKRIGNPADSVRALLYSNSGGEPDEILATSGWITGSTISNAAFVETIFNLNVRVTTNRTYHFVLERSSSAPDAANHYEISTNTAGGAEDHFGFPGPSPFDLEGNINGSQTTLAVVAGQGANADTPPFLAKIDAEIMRVTAVNTDTFTIVRARLGTAGAAHLDEADIHTPDWTAISDSLVFKTWIVGSGGHVDPTPPDPRPVNGILVSHPDNQRVWIFGGHGDDVESWFATNFIPHGGTRWFSEIAQGDGLGAMPRNANETVVDVVVSHPVSHDLGLIFERTGGGVPDNPYAYTEQFFPVGEAGWQIDLTGAFVTPGADGVAVAGNNNQVGQFGAVLDNKTFYVADNGLNWWPIADVLPGTGANRPHSLLNIQAWKDIYLAATDEGIAKSVDRGETWAFFRGAGGGSIVAWPGGAIGWDVAIAYRRPRRFDLMAIVRDDDASTENALALRRGHAEWVDEGPLPSGHSDFPHRLWHFPQINDQTAFYIRYTNGAIDHDEDLYRSTDLGSTPTTWSGVLDHCGTITRGPDGRIWASAESHADPTGHLGNSRYPHAIYFSDDDGATWTVAHVDSRNVAGQHITYYNIAVDPNNHKRVMAVGRYPATNIRVLVTEDAHLGAGATWSEVTPTGVTGFEGSAPRYHQPLLLAGENGRWILGKQLVGVNTLEIWVSDNNGAAWTLKYSINMSGATQGFSDAFRMGNILFFGGGMIGGAADRAGRISFNNGDDWVELTADAGGHQGFVYDPRLDMLITNVNSSDELKFMQPPREGRSWIEGIEPGLDTAMGYAAEMVENALAVMGT